MTQVVITEQPRPSAPVFSTLEEERSYRKQHLAAALRIFGRFGFSIGTAGHITARDPERLDHFWINPYGMHFSRVKVSDLLLVNHEGQVVEGNRPVNHAGFAIHSQVHAARPDVVGVAHAHSINGRAWSSLGRLLAPVDQDTCAFYGDHALFSDFTGKIEPDDGEKIARSLKGGKALILQNHGLLTAGQSVDEAAWWFIQMERACQVQLLAEAAGEPIVIGDEAAARVASQSGSSRAGWFAFQSLYDWIVEEEPALLD